MDFSTGNHITLLKNGVAYFPALEIAIANAKHAIYLQTYIFQADATGLRIGNALKQAAMRGVSVYVLLDGYGCRDLQKDYIDDLKDYGVNVKLYRPKISPWTLQKNRLRRMHRKIVTIDGVIAFIGGINIIDDYNVPDNIAPRVDYAVRLEGPILEPILESVYQFWHRKPWHTALRASIKYWKNTQLAEISNTALATKAAFVIRDNFLHRRDIEKAYLSAISQATSEVLIANAYFLPSYAFRKALLKAALRGVNVKLLVQGRKDIILMLAMQAFYEPFLKSGIEIYEYHKSFLHCKACVIDAYWATVGSSNIDPFSLFFSNEANVIMLDEVFAKSLQDDITANMTNACQVTLKTLQKRGAFKRIFAWIIYAVMRSFLSMIGNKSA
jgi:cardiolipin synthase A/B